MEEGGRNNLIQPPAISVDTTNIMRDIDEKWQKLKATFTNDNLFDVTSFMQIGTNKNARIILRCLDLAEKLLASGKKRTEGELTLEHFVAFSRSAEISSGYLLVLISS